MIQLSGRYKKPDRESHLLGEVLWFFLWFLFVIDMGNFITENWADLEKNPELFIVFILLCLTITHGFNYILFRSQKHSLKEQLRSKQEVIDSLEKQKSSFNQRINVAEATTNKYLNELRSQKSINEKLREELKAFKKMDNEMNPREPD